MSTPDLSPLVAAQLICHECGQAMKMKVVKGRKGQKETVDHLEYVCKNPKTGCKYKVSSTLMHSGEMVALRDDGEEVRLPE